MPNALLSDIITKSFSSVHEKKRREKNRILLFKLSKLTLFFFLVKLKRLSGNCERVDDLK